MIAGIHISQVTFAIDILGALKIPLGLFLKSRILSENKAFLRLALDQRFQEQTALLFNPRLRAPCTYENEA